MSRKTNLFILAALAAFILPLPASAQDYISGLIARWTLDEDSGTSAADSIGTSTGTLTGGLSATNDSSRGMNGKALHFDGSNDYINMGNVLPLSGQQSFTLSTWVYFDVDPLTNTDFFIEKGNNYWLWWHGGNNFALPDNHLVFGYYGGGYRDFTTAWTPQANRWYLITVAHDATADTVTFYVDGVPIGQSTTATYTLASSTSNLNLGRRTSGNNYFDGYMDDVRMYNRALTAADALALYNATYSEFSCSSPLGVTGEITFNTKHRVMQYCDSSSWVAMGKKPYIPGSVYLNGSTYLRNSNLMSFTDSKLVTGSFWIKQAAPGVGYTLLYNTTSIFTRYFFISLLGSDALQFVARSTGGGSGLMVTTVNTISDTDWHHVAFSFDMSDPTRRHVMIDGVESPLTIGNYNDVVLEFTHTDNYFSSGYLGLASPFNGYIADFWLETDLYMDLSDPTNVERFMLDGEPVNLGVDGSLAVGYAPDVFLSGDTATWYENKGTAEDYVLNGSLGETDIAASLNGISEDISSGLVGHWKLDETSGTTVADSIGSNNGTWTDAENNNLAEESVSGHVNTALNFDAADNMVITSNANALESLNNLSVSLWFYPRGTNRYTIFGAWVNNNQNLVEFGYAANSNAAARVWGTSGLDSTAAVFKTAFTVNAWNHAVITYDGTTRLYINGILAATGAALNLPTRTGSSDGIYWGGTGNIYDFDGYMDEIKIYNRTLSDNEVFALYNATGSQFTCLSPNGTTGAITYNSTHNVMQYCNGAKWIPMGLAGAGGGGCSNPSGVAGSLTYNTSYNTMQYCDGTAWHAVGKTPTPSVLTNGLVGHWRLDETTGSTIADSSTTSANGAWVDNVNDDVAEESAAAVASNGLTFDNTDDRIDISYYSALELTDAGGTVAAWINIADANLGWDGIWPIFWKQRNSNVFNPGGYMLTLHHGGPTGPAYLGIRYGDGSLVKSTVTAFNASQWYHVLATWDSTNIYLYVNGTLEHTEALPASLVYDEAANSRIGYGADFSGTHQHADGIIDDVRVYNVTFDAADVTALYNSY